MALLGRNEFFGEKAILSDEFEGASVRALEMVELMVL